MRSGVSPLAGGPFVGKDSGVTVLGKTIEGKALITGASGFIGSNLRSALLEAGADVVAIRRKTSPEPDEGRSVVADYADQEQLREVIREERPDWVFHVAGATNGVSYEDFQRANVMPTRNLLAAIEKEHPDVRRFVHVSSLASYGPAALGRPISEDAPRRPIEHYGRSKLEAEQVVEAMGSRVPWTIIRPSGVYGPRDAEFFILFREISKGRNVFYGNREREISVVYVDDCVRAMVDAALSADTVGRGYFLADGEPVTWEGFQSAIVEAVGRRPWNIDVPSFVLPIAAWGGEALAKIDGKPRLFNLQKKKMGEQDAWTCDSGAAVRDFGWTIQVDQQEGIRRSLDWYREHAWL